MNLNRGSKGAHIFQYIEYTCFYVRKSLTSAEVEHAHLQNNLCPKLQLKSWIAIGCSCARYFFVFIIFLYRNSQINFTSALRHNDVVLLCKIAIKQQRKTYASDFFISSRLCCIDKSNVETKILPLLCVIFSKPRKNEFSPRITKSKKTWQNRKTNTW